VFPSVKSKARLIQQKNESRKSSFPMLSQGGQS